MEGGGREAGLVQGVVGGGEGSLVLVEEDLELLLVYEGVLPMGEGGFLRVQVEKLGESVTVKSRVKASHVQVEVLLRFREVLSE